MTFIYFFLSFNSIAQDTPKEWKAPTLMIETNDYQLYQTIDDNYWRNRYLRNAKDTTLGFISLHVTPSRYLFQLFKKSEKDTISTWSFISTGGPGAPLWIFENGTICFSRYGHLGFRILEETYHPIIMTEPITQPDHLKAIDANELGLFVYENTEPYKAYFITWKAIKKNKWSSKKQVSSNKGMSDSYGSFFLRENTVFTEHQGHLTYYNLITNYKDSFNLNTFFDTPGYMDLGFIHFHHQELIFRYSNQNYAFHIKTKKIRGLNTLSPTKNNNRIPQHPKDYNQPDSLHVVIREDEGVLMQSKTGRLYLFNWLNEMDHELDFTGGQLVSDHDGISRQEIQRYLNNVTWQSGYVCTVGINKLNLFDLKTNQLVVYHISNFNCSKSYSSTTKYKSFFHFNYYAPEDLSEVTEIVHIHGDQIYLHTSDGPKVFDLKTKELYAPNIIKYK